MSRLKGLFLSYAYECLSLSVDMNNATPHVLFVKSRRLTVRKVGRGRGRARPTTVISDEIGATVIDHVLVDEMTMREAGQRVQPTLSGFSVATITRYSEKKLQDYYMRVAGLHCSPKSKRLSVLIWSFKTVPFDCYRECLNWQASIWRRGEGEAGTYLANAPLWTSLASAVVAMSPFVQP
ncbi:hypothetical protein N1851_011834 [Merluccius polli]|uniref:Uncharacterized protein n=1 Tax=Merluccius polli TaxID=89951 RepID=A0AA47MY47_MERPO|nr:hypothetical protein N1851_011834 [Merluccius polli]